MADVQQPVTRDWSFARSVAGVAVLVGYAVEVGIPAREALAGTGLAAGDLADPDQVVTADQELRVVRNLIAAGCGDAGSAVGRRYHVSTFGIAGYALISSRTLLDALNFVLRFLDLTFIFAIPSVRVDGDRVVLEFDVDSLPADVREFLAQRDLAAVAAVTDEVLASHLPILVSADWRRLSFPVSDLDRELPQANPATRALCENLCADLASQRRDGSGLAQQVRIVLAQRLSFDPTMPGVAAALVLSERTLRRRLADSGTSFQQLLDEVRASLAGRLLASGTLSVEEIALRLGYAEASSFISAHKRWHGSTPTGRAPA